MRQARFFSCSKLLSALVAFFAFSQAPAQIPDKFTNLQILDQDSNRSQVIGQMRMHASALGVRCNHCHVGENAATLEGFDFASDEKETKRIARLMMKMVKDINSSHLGGIGRLEHLEVKCVTCHRGLTKPQTLRDAVLAKVEAEGAEAAEKHYRSLREQYHGRASYDFGAGTLNSVSETLARQKNDLDSALAMIRLNIEFHPDSAYSHAILAQLLMAKNDREGAVASLKRALEIEPGNQFYEGMLKRIQQPRQQ